MNDKFDELAKGMALSVTRRSALKKFGLGLAGLALASLGLANTAHAGPKRFRCHCNQPNYGCRWGDSDCYLTCVQECTTQF